MVVRDGPRSAALAVLCAGMFVTVMDTSIVNLALPSIQAALAPSQSALAWVMNAYLLVFGVLLLPAGRLADVVGARRVYVAGLLWFSAASLGAAVAPDVSWLIAARAVQGLGGALAAAPVLGMIATYFPASADRSNALGVYAFAGSFGAVAALVLGGVLLPIAGFRVVFCVAPPVAVTAAAFLRRALPPPPARSIAPAARSLAALRSPLLLGANGVQVLMVAAMFGFQFTSALYLRQVLGLEPRALGLALLPVPLLIGAFSLVARPAIARFSERRVMLGGLAAVAAGLAYLCRAPVQGSYLTDVLPALTLLGAGMGLSHPPMMAIGMAGVGERDHGLASGLFGTTMQLGGAAGIAGVAFLASYVTAARMADGNAPAAALAAGYGAAFGAGALLATAAFAAGCALPRIRDRAP